jgi:signal transduction histidine kinase
LSISDNGQGFNPEFSTRIFEPFKRLHGPNVPGSGIGLAVCKRMVDRMGGRIWAESTPGEGSTFYFTLPIEQKK